MVFFSVVVVAVAKNRYGTGFYCDSSISVAVLSLSQYRFAGFATAQ